MEGFEKTMRFSLLLFLGSINLTFTQAQLNFSLAMDSSVSVPIRLSPEDSISVLRFYISDIRVVDGRKTVWKSEKQHYLIDFNRGQQQNNNVHGQKGGGLKDGVLKFVLGVDDNTSAKGIGEGPLDPIQGMYWTWQSGYINFKFEGVSSQSPSRKSRFQMHLGGFQKPFRSAQSVELQISETNTKVVFNLKKFMSEINLKEEHTIMSPSEKAVSLMQVAKSCFYVQ